MSSEKISDLTSTTVQSSDITVIARSGSNYQITLTNNFIPYLSGTQSAILALTPSAITLAFSTDTNQLFFYNLTSWVISA